MKACVITLGIAEKPPRDHPPLVRDFSAAIRRLEASLADVGFRGDFFFWDDDYPTGCPPHREAPYAFKPFCFHDAVAQGYDLILWLDSTIRVLKPIDVLFERIAREGYVFFAEDHSVGEYCKDEALATLDIGREESFALRSCWASALGIGAHTTRGAAFLRKWKELATDGITFPGPRWSGVRGFPVTASSDRRVKGHRHDQTAASVIAARLGMDAWLSKRAHGHFFEDNRKAVPTFRAERLKTREPPEVSPTRPRESVLFFSRGRGRGHAIPDLAMVEAARRIDPSFEFHFASYGTGAETFRAHGWGVFDLGLPDDASFTATLFAANALVRTVRPALVVAHEEFSAITAAKMEGVPCVLITDWLPVLEHPAGEAAALADAAVIITEPGIMPLPPALRAKARFVGPVVRPMRYEREDRARARMELGLAPEALVVSVIPGAWATEERAPLADLACGAFSLLPAAGKTLLWLSKSDGDAVRAASKPADDVRLIADCDAIEQVMVASDLVVTKGNRGTLFDAASLGIPSISVSFGQNPIDDILIAGIASNRALNRPALEPATLANAIMRVVRQPIPERARPLDLHCESAERAAEVLLGELRRLIAGDAAPRETGTTGKMGDGATSPPAVDADTTGVDDGPHALDKLAAGAR